MKIVAREKDVEPITYLDSIDFSKSFLVFVDRADKTIYTNDESGHMISLSDQSDYINITDEDLRLVERECWVFDNEKKVRDKIKELVNEMW